MIAADGPAPLSALSIVALACALGLALRPVGKPNTSDAVDEASWAETAAGLQEVARLEARHALGKQLLDALSAELDAGRVPRELAAAYGLLRATEDFVASRRRCTRGDRRIPISEACKRNALAKECM